MSETKVLAWPFLQTPLGKGPSCLFQLLVAPGVPWLVATSLRSLPHVHVASPCVRVSVSFCHKGTIIVT